ncbi:MAG: hypothetical protein IPO32_11320 [Crocinitomicaceae bacterium]|nr:hypothetical protein [Crocinitomicaceae bacterium]
MKKILLFAFGSIAFIPTAFNQTPVSLNTDQTIAPANSVTCNAGGVPTAENRFFHIYDLADYTNITDTAFFVRARVAVETTAGGAYEIVAKMHSIVGTANIANLTLIVSDTAAVTPDANSYFMNVPFTSGYALPGDSIVGEYNLPLATIVTFFPGSSTTAASGPTYIIASGCSINDFTTIASLGFANMHLIMTIYVNQKPVMDGFAKSVINNVSLDFVASDFTAEFSDNDNDGLTMIKVTSLPANGTLDLSGTTLVLGDTILHSEIDLLSYTPNTGYVGVESFSVIARDSSHWSNTPAVVDINVTPFGLGNVENQISAVFLSPNPVSDVLTIRLNEAITSYKIIDATGKEFCVTIECK